MRRESRVATAAPVIPMISRSALSRAPIDPEKNPARREKRTRNVKHSKIRQDQHTADCWSTMRIMRVAALACCFLAIGSINAQEPSTPPTDGAGSGAILLTVFLKHDQSKTLPEINDQLKRQGYYKAFPPAGIEVVSWYIMMGVGQVITLRVPPNRLRDVNRALEETAWGAYRTEFYPTYDYKQIGEAEHGKAQGG